MDCHYGAGIRLLDGDASDPVFGAAQRMACEVRPDRCLFADPDGAVFSGIPDLDFPATGQRKGKGRKNKQNDQIKKRIRAEARIRFLYHKNREGLC